MKSSMSVNCYSKSRNKELNISRYLTISSLVYVKQNTFVLHQMVPDGITGPKLSRLM